METSPSDLSSELASGFAGNLSHTISSRSETVPVAVSQNTAVIFQKVIDYISLTKPKIISLLLISTCCPMILASGGKLDPMIMVWTLIGGTLVTGSASAINCIWDRDIDRLMRRTAGRPLAACRTSVLGAWVFAALLLGSGFGLLYWAVNPAAAWASLSGHLFYVLIYTMWLKRSTPQNIVIGGAAGAIPPLVGWAAATGRIELSAALIFLVVFLWTPPHFWALALNKNEDYRRAGVPMLPVVSGAEVTHRQMLVYALLLLPVSLLLVAIDPRLGWFSGVALSILGLMFAWRCWELKQAPLEAREKRAWGVFGFSLLYLALFFVTLVIDGAFV